MMNKVLLASVAVVVIGAGAGGAYWYANYRAKTLVDERFAAMVAAGQFDAAEYESVRVHPTGAVTIRNLRLADDGVDFTLRQVAISAYDYAREIPRYADIEISGANFAPTPAPNTHPAAMVLGNLLEQLGVDEEVPLQFHYTWRYDPDNAHQAEFAMTLSITETFVLEASTVARNLDMAALRVENTDQRAAVVRAAAIPSLTVALQDQGFLENLLEARARDLGVTAEEYRRLLVSQAQNLYLFLPPGDQSVAMAASAELAEFLEGGKTLTVKLAPEYGGKVEQLQQEIMGAVFIGDFNKVGALLHLEITTD